MRSPLARCLTTACIITTTARDGGVAAEGERCCPGVTCYPAFLLPARGEGWPALGMPSLAATCLPSVLGGDLLLPGDWLRQQPLSTTHDLLPAYLSVWQAFSVPACVAMRARCGVVRVEVPCRSLPLSPRGVTRRWLAAVRRGSSGILLFVAANDGER